MAEPERRHRPMSERLTTSEDPAAIRAEWEALHAAVPGAGPFTHPAWHENWLRHFAAAARPAPVYLAVREGEALVGVAVLDLCEPGAATLLGDHDVCDYGGPLALPGHERTVTRGVIEWLMEDMTPVLRLWGMRAESPLRAAFAVEAAALGWTLEESPEAPAPVVALPATFDAYLAALGKHDRHELRRKLRHIEAAGSVSFVQEHDEAAILAHMDTLFAMMRASHDGKREFLAPGTEAFFRGLAQAFAPSGMVHLALLRLNGVPVAAVFAFEDAEATYLYNSGYDPEYARLAVGLVSKAFAIRAAIDAGKRRFEFLRGAEPYKAHLGGAGGELLTLTLAHR